MRRRAPRVFVSYRREDASGHAGRLYDVLAERFGDGNVFMDVDTIEVGADFTEAITRAVTSCDALIALIGRDWATVTDDTGRRRIEDPEDFVRLELETALEREIAVLPVCVRGAPFPTEADLPASLAPLARRQGADLRDTAWRDDVQKLIGRLESIVRPDEVRRRPWWRSRRGVAAGVAVAVLVAAAAVAVVLLLGDGAGVRGSAFPNGAERQLLAVVPAITRPTCQRIDWGDEAATAALSCSAAGTAADYYLFDSEQVRDAWYARTRDEVGVEPLSGSCTPKAFGGEATFDAGGARGRYVCWREGQEPLMAWTQGANAVGARANNWKRGGEAGAASLLRQWRCCLRPAS
ncbi:MAG TPA: toll/interleukin-1 receptor domain-containing protein [Gaiellaceae bacterium]|nr:toll/interleukin-1 receptor domain-containing protein [Gaiellaceae bacterium]